MYGLTNEELLKIVIEKSVELGITAYEFGDKTEISTVGAHNILTGESKNPRKKNLIIMLEYLQSIQLGSDKKIKEPIIHKVEELSTDYKTTLESIIFDRMYAQLKPEIDNLKKKIDDLEVELNKFKKE